MTTRMRQLVDWSAAVWAGIIGGIMFLLFTLFLLPIELGGSSHHAWNIISYWSSLLLGEDTLSPLFVNLNGDPLLMDAVSFQPINLVVGSFIHLAMSIGFALLVAFLVHRWGFFTGILLGGCLGLCLYLINFYTMTNWFDSFINLRSSIMMWAHILFGALVGGIYEGLEVEEFVTD